MVEELKIFIDSAKEAENLVIAKGAIFTQETQVEDTYFVQPAGEVLKLTIDNDKSTLVKLKAQNNGFSFLSQDIIENPQQKIAELTKKLGIKCVLRKIIRYFKFQEFQINILQIENLGNFLIVEGEKVDKKVIEEALGFIKPRYLTISFDKLKEQHG